LNPRKDPRTGNAVFSGKKKEKERERKRERKRKRKREINK